MVTFDPRPLVSKPNETYAKTITSNLIAQYGVTIHEFSELVSPPYSLAWSGAIFNGTRSNVNWIEQSVIGLDFDKGTTPVDEVYSRLQQFKIVPQLWYTTFSDSPNLRKFRVVIFLESGVKNISLYEFIQSALSRMFPQMDVGCKDLSRFFFGGRECTVVHDNPISTSQFIDALSIHVMTSDSNSTRKIPLELDYYASLKSAEKWNVLYYKYRNVHFSASETPNTTSGKEGSKETIDINLARQRIKILDEFLNGRWLYHNELFGLATNLIKIKGGMKLMKETMIRFNNEGKTQYTQNNFNILPYINKVDYSPQPIYKFSPFQEDKEQLDIVSATKDVRGYIEILEPIEKVQLSEGESLLRMKFGEVIRNGEAGKIYLFVFPTSIGKTDLLKDTHATIAAPTNALKNEIAGKMTVKHETSPDRLGFENESLNNKLSYYYSIGLPQKSSELLYYITNPANSGLNSENDINQAKEYLKKLKSASESSDAVLTTHKRALYTQYKHDTIIFDEDPLNSLLEIKEIKLSDLITLNLLTRVPGLQYITDYLNDTIPTDIHQTPTFSIDLDELIDKISVTKIESNVIDFLGSTYFVRDGLDRNKFQYVVKKELPENKKIIIMSATLPVYIYRKLYGDRIHVVDFTDVKHTGTITQYTNRSCSRNGLRKYGEKISEKVGDLPVLTFGSYQHLFKNPIKNMYFGNCLGYDGMKGKDMAVVGTPHRDNVAYFLIAKVLGIDFKSTDTSMIYQKVEFNGFRFKFKSFIHDDLRAIQLSFIESDLIQAVGRARTLRTDAHVDVYSNFPLRISDEFRW